MDDTRTILCRHIITWNHAECLVFLHHYLVVFQCTRLYPRHQLLVVQTHEVCAFTFPQNLRLLIFAKLEVCRQTCFCHDVDGFLFCIWILTFDGNIVNLGTNTQCSIGRKCPRSGCPCEDVCFQVVRHFANHFAFSFQTIAYIFHKELCRHRCVLHIAVAARLVQFVAGKTRTCCW